MAKRKLIAELSHYLQQEKGVDVADIGVAFSDLEPSWDLVSLPSL